MAGPLGGQRKPGHSCESGWRARSGALDFSAILAAAHAAGVAHHFVEQDYTPGDPIESLKKSYAYLDRLGAR